MQCTTLVSFGAGVRRSKKSVKTRWSLLRSPRLVRLVSLRLWGQHPRTTRRSRSRRLSTLCMGALWLNRHDGAPHTHNSPQWPRTVAAIFVLLLHWETPPRFTFNPPFQKQNKKSVAVLLPLAKNTKTPPHAHEHPWRRLLVLGWFERRTHRTHTMVEHSCWICVFEAAAVKTAAKSLCARAPRERQGSCCRARAQPQHTKKHAREKTHAKTNSRSRVHTKTLSLSSLSSLSLRLQEVRQLNTKEK